MIPLVPALGWLSLLGLALPAISSGGENDQGGGSPPPKNRPLQPLPAGAKIWSGAVPKEVTAKAIEIRDNPSTYPFGGVFDLGEYAGRHAVARVEEHTWTYVDGQKVAKHIPRGVTIYQVPSGATVSGSWDDESEPEQSVTEVYDAPGDEDGTTFSNDTPDEMQNVPDVAPQPPSWSPVSVRLREREIAPGGTWDEQAQSLAMPEDAPTDAEYDAAIVPPDESDQEPPAAPNVPPDVSEPYAVPYVPPPVDLSPHSVDERKSAAGLMIGVAAGVGGLLLWLLSRR